ncbi:hypothetical protein A1OC_02359 [Stenotrophomonas maltophilia Ab55555]|nr:hypothetical protein A1OC_02359 [Stenotrophomonas maltophilia Ab55555]
MWRSANLLGLFQLREFFWADKTIVGNASHALIDLGDSQGFVHPLSLVGRCFVVHERSRHIRVPKELGQFLLACAGVNEALSGCMS